MSQARRWPILLLLVLGLVLFLALFRNPLAGPSVLGISSGASLGVAMLLLGGPLLYMLPVPRDAALVLAAFGGSLLVLMIILLADRRLGDGTTLLIVGLMVGYLCSACILGVAAALLLVKPLNALLLGEEQAASLGVPVESTRRWIMWITGILAGTITAFCGPIAFLGLATPHVARGLVRTSDHSILLPTTMLCGAVLALACDLFARSPGFAGALPLNSVTSLLGAPVVVWVLWSGKRWARSA